MTTEKYLGYADYAATIDCLIPIAGTGNTDQIRTALGELAERRERLVEALAALEPCPVTGRITDNEIKIALGEHGDIWPASIYGAAVIARLEDAANRGAISIIEMP